MKNVSTPAGSGAESRRAVRFARRGAGHRSRGHGTMRIADLLAFGVNNGASDLHLSAGLPPMIRVDGDLRRIEVPELGHEAVHGLVSGVMNDAQRKDYEDRLETDFSFEIPDLARFRVNAFNHHRGAGAVFRTIPSRVPSLEELRAPEIFRTIAGASRGVVLVTGPTGSGKSTTLAAMVDHKNESERGHILTIEDPIEFVHRSKQCLVSQREVHRHTLGFAEALRSALREDPDVVLVGEMRDIETIRLALTAAETGHLVLGTLHTSSAAKTIDRVVDVFPAAEKDMVRAMLSESLSAVVSQALLKRNGERYPDPVSQKLTFRRYNSLPADWQVRAVQREGGLLVKSTGLRIERSRVPVPLAAEIYFSSGCTQPYPKN